VGQITTLGCRDRENISRRVCEWHADEARGLTDTELWFNRRVVRPFDLLTHRKTSSVKGSFVAWPSYWQSDELKLRSTDPTYLSHHPTVAVHACMHQLSPITTVRQRKQRMCLCWRHLKLDCRKLAKELSVVGFSNSVKLPTFCYFEKFE